MFTSIAVNNFRGFQRLRIPDLARVNVFVGRNNCGKTSVLEAAELLTGGENPSVLIRSVRRRGEMALERTGGYDVSHMFYGHRAQLGSKFDLQGINGLPVTLECEIVPAPDVKEQQPTLFGPRFDGDSSESLAIKYSTQPKPILLPLQDSNVLSINLIRRISMTLDREPVSAPPVQFVATEGMTALTLSTLWDAVALTAEEEQVNSALQIIEPGVERIAFLSSPERHGVAGIYVKIKNLDERIPLGSLGDGVKRLLMLSLSLIRATDGTALVDEIDTGLHYTAMGAMWKMVVEVATRLNVQVFATTHSQDCVTSLAQLYQREPELCSGVRLHRIESGTETTIAYTAGDIAEAAAHHIEVR